KERGVVIDSNSYLGFEFTIGVQLDSKAVDITFPVVFDSRGVAVPQPLQTPPTPTRADVPIPTIVPMLLKPADGAAPTFKDASGKSVEVRIPSVLVIPGNVGYLKQFFSAQLFVANGAPAGSGLTVRDVTGKINLPPGADRVLGTTDDPLSLPDKVDGPQPATLTVRGLGADGQAGTPDDTGRFAPGEQGMAEFVIRGDKEGFHNLDFDIAATLDGLATGPVIVNGKASGGVLVRNPYFDMSFTVPAVARQGEEFKVFVTVNNISQSLANDVRVTLDGSRMSGAQLVSDPTQTIPTLKSRDSATLSYTFRSQRTGQVAATYLKFDTTNGTTGALNFTLAVGERGVALSPDTLVLPSALDNLPADVVTAAMRVLGQGWSVANAPTGSLPATVTRTSKAIVTQKALALAEAGLRVGFGQSPVDAVRDLVFDFSGGSPVDAGFDQILRQTEAGREFARAAGNALRPAMTTLGNSIQYERATAQLAASGPDFITFSIGNGSSAAPLSVTVSDPQNRKASAGSASSPFTSNDIPGATLVPLGASNGPALGIITAPTGAYTLDFGGQADGTADVSVTLPRGGSFARFWLSGFHVVPGGRYRLVADPARTSLVLDVDSNGDGAYESQQSLQQETLYPQGPTFISATVIGPETLAGASPFGFQTALLFDRVVDATSAANKSAYTIPANEVLSAKRQLSGRLVFVTLGQPEGPYIPSSLSVSGLTDMRGVRGPGGTAPLQSRLADKGAVVSGRILNADGTGVSSAVLTYAQNPIIDCAPPLDDYAGLTNVTTDASGHYELRYVRQDACGMPFKLVTRDPGSGAAREVSSSVRTAGEQIVLDIALFGRGSIAGVVKDLGNRPVANAGVVAISETDPQVSGTAVTDLTGAYRIDNITVGGVRVTAAKDSSVGRAAGRIDRAGTVATVNLTLDGGAVSAAGTVRKVENGVFSVVPALQVVYYSRDGGTFVPIAVTTTSSSGAYSFTGMPVGEYRIDAALNTRDHASVSGIAAANDSLSGKDIIIDVQSVGSGTVRGNVQLPGGSPASGAVVTIDDRGVLTDASGHFDLSGVAVRPNISRILTARTRDGLRSGTNAVIVGTANQVVDNVTITLSGVGTADFVVLDAAKRPMPNQEVVLLSFCDSSCGCGPVQTGADGHVQFHDLALGSITARTTALGTTFVDQATATVSITRDGATAFGILQFAGAGTVTGTVLDPSGNPALGADVALQSKVFDDENCTLDAGISHRARTDEQGKFRFTGVNGGAVAVTVTHPFYPAASGQQGTLAKAGDTLDLNFRLTNTTSGELTGTVFLPDGTTPAGGGIEVTANGALPDVTVTTDALGKFRFARIFPAGGYSLTARDPITGGIVRDSIYLQAAQDMQHDLRLKGRGTVQVRVVDGADAPVANAFVRLTETDYPNHTYEGVVQPSNQGLVTFENVFEGRVSAEASDVFARGGRTSSVLPRPGDTVTLKVALTVTGKVSGHFFRPDGTTGIPFGSVKLIAGGRVIGQTTTDGSADPGAYSF
ncbi:MAG: LamG domain protein jellyroll fold domain protein, partial [Acidobacteria bacterium]|nr:LamG domain protein jellyroll fold domain protein [Acidobacteriota bacterium]